MIRQIHDSFGDIPNFVHNSELPPASSGMLQEIIDDLPTKRKLSIELAITIDVCLPFVTATYKLEGDGPRVLTDYEELSKLLSAVALSHHPNTAAVARHLSGGDSIKENQLVAYGNICAKKQPLPIFSRSSLSISSNKWKLSKQLAISILQKFRKCSQLAMMWIVSLLFLLIHQH